MIQRSIFGLGIEGSSGTLVNIIEGKDLAKDEHYNKGRFDGKWNKEILIDNRTANLLDVQVGGTIHLGISVAITIGILTSFVAALHVNRMNTAELLRNG